jgi:hypothetical protein
VKKVISIALLVIIAALTAGYFYMHSPTYTINKIKESVINHDWAGLNSYVDLDSLYENTVTKALEEQDSSIAKGIGMMMGANMKEAFMSQIKKGVEDSSRATDESMFASMITDMSNTDNYTQDNQGKITTVTIKKKTSFLHIPTSMSMSFRDEGLKYVLIGVNTDKMSSVKIIETKLLKEHVMFPIKAQLNKSLSIKTIVKTKGCSNYIGNSCIENLMIVEAKITNNADKTIKSAVISLYPGKEYLNIENERRINTDVIRAGESIVYGQGRGWKQNRFREADNIFMNATANDLVYQSRSIEFEDGEIIREDDSQPYIDVLKNTPTIQDILERRKQYGVTDNYGVEVLL